MLGEVQDDMQRLDDLDLDILKPEWGDRDSVLLLQHSATKIGKKGLKCLKTKHVMYLHHMYLFCFSQLLYIIVDPRTVSMELFQGPFGEEKLDWLRTGATWGPKKRGAACDSIVGSLPNMFADILKHTFPTAPSAPSPLVIQQRLADGFCPNGPGHDATARVFEKAFGWASCDSCRQVGGANQFP